MVRPRRWWLRWGPVLIVGVLCLASPFSAWWISRRSPLDSPTNHGAYQQTGAETRQGEPEEPWWERLAVRTVNDPVALWTLWLVIFTGLLACVSIRQFKYLRRADEIARTAATAAQTSANAALIQARAAAISLRGEMCPAFPDRPQRDGTPWKIRIVVENIGAAPATLMETVAEFRDHIDIDNPIILLNARSEPDSTTLNPRQQKVIAVFESPTITEGQFLFGYFIFRDKIGYWKRRFCMQVWANPTKGFNQYYFEEGGDAQNGEEYLGTTAPARFVASKPKE